MNKHPEFDCVECDISTFDNKEYYMVKDYIWKTHGAGKGMLCINCLEKRMGRKLVWKDFTDAPVNYVFKVRFGDKRFQYGCFV